MSKPSDIARIAGFSAAISAATAQIKGFYARVGVLPNVFGTAARQIAEPSANTTHAMTTGQLLTTRYHGDREVPSNGSSNRSSFLGKLERVFDVGATASVDPSLLTRPVKRFLATCAGRPVINALVEPGQALAKWTGIMGAVAATRAIAVGSRGAGDSSEAVPANAKLLAAAAAIAAFIRATSFEVRSPGPIWQRPLTLEGLLGGEMAIVMERIGSAVSAVIDNIGIGIEHTLVSIGGDKLYHPANSHASLIRRKALAPSWRVLVASSAAHSTLAVLKALRPSDISPDFQSRLTTLRKVDALAMLAAPVLAAPVPSAAPLPQRGVEAMYAPTIIINSTPTLVINSSQTADIEHRVLEALCQHRDALYEQWHREVKRRQRTDF